MPRSEKIQPDPRPSALSDRIAPYWIAILLLPALVLWHRDDALYSPLWQSDPWFYLGYFRDLVDFKRNLFPDFYYGSRLSWILPGYLLHSFLRPVIANAILHLTVHSIATLSFFVVLRWTIGLRSAYLTAMMFSLHPWLWSATGWDHVNGAAIAYYLLAMALLTRAARGPYSRAILILAGAAIAGSVFAHLFLFAFVPLLLVYYAGLAWARRGALAVRSLPSDALWLSLGFVFVTLPLCAINYLWVDGNFWFWSPSLKTARAVTTSYIWSESIWVDGKLVSWLWFVILACVIALALLPVHWKDKRRNAAALLFSAQLLLATALMAFFQARGITLLGHYYYACYLLPFAFLVIGASFWPAVAMMPARTFAIACGLATLLFGALWYDPAAHPIPDGLELALGGLLIVPALLLRNRASGAVLALASLAILTSAVYSGSFRLVSLHGTRADYTRIMNARQHIESLRNRRPIRFWYDKQEPQFFEYFALNASYLAEFARIGEAFPLGCTAPADPNTLIVVTSQKENTAELARAALADCWRTFGTRPTIEDVETIPRPGQPYKMAVLFADARVSSKYPLPELVRTIALDSVKLGAPKALLERLPDGLRVTTIPGYGAFAARVDLALDLAVKTELAVHITARTLQGKVGFGILNPDTKSFLVERSLTPATETMDVVLPLPSPAAIGPLIVSNTASSGVISKALIEEIGIRKVR